MNKKLQSAFETEKSGDYKTALKMYSSLDAENLSFDDRVFLLRSIGACNYYLQNYSEAQNHFHSILEMADITANVRKEVLTSLNLCYLYGGNPEKAKNHFLEDIKTDSSSQDKMWDFWYLGQCDFLIKDYEKMVSDYQMAVKISEENQIGNLPFFISHLMVALLLVNNEEAFLKNHDKIKAYEDTSYGLLKIVTAIYRKRKGYPDWNELNSKGIKEAEENKYKENIKLGEFLFKKYD